jgi:hypothetical protein
VRKMLQISNIPDGAKYYVKKLIPIQAIQIMEEFEVVTLEGTMIGRSGDWLMRGIEGELYPCADNIFKKSYEEFKEV